MFKHGLATTVVAAFSFASSAALAEELGSGTLTPDNPVLTIESGPHNTSNPSAQVEQTCNEQLVCDFFDLTVDVSEAWLLANPNARLRVTGGWPDPSSDAGGPSATDFDFYLRSATGSEVAGTTGATSANPEMMQVVPTPGSTDYRVVIVPFLVAGQTATVRMELDPGSSPSGGGASVTKGGPAMAIYRPNNGMAGIAAREPTIGLDRNTDEVFFMAGFDQARVSFDDSTSPATALWEDVSAPIPINFTSLDPFITDDPHPYADGSYNPTIWLSHLLGATSMIGITSDRGESWLPSQGGGAPHGADNQSFAAGPYPDGMQPLSALSDRALYYCSHSVVNAFCSRSDDGGLTFNPSRVAFPLFGVETSDLCNNHGHVQVGPDGTVYLPMNNTCQGSQGVSISVDAGNTFHFVTVPDTVRGRWDSYIAIANDGETIYYAYGEEGDDRPMVIVGTLDKSNPSAPTIHWEGPAVDVGAPFGLKNIVFPSIIAGDPDRAAFAFHGTTFEGDSGSVSEMQGAVWHMYLATTYDRGQNWEVQQLEPADPTQRNSVCDAGAGCEDSPPHRNLLDFMDIEIDSKGRIIIGYADGCTGTACVVDGTMNYDDAAVIARQSAGKTLLSAFDGTQNQIFPGAPSLEAARTAEGVLLNWSEPTAGQSAITGYTVERALEAGGFEQLATTTERRYLDTEVTDPDAVVTYRVFASNSQGMGAASNEVSPASLAPAVCTLPGDTVATDDSGDNATPDPQYDIESLSVATVYASTGPYKITFTLKVAGFDSPPLPDSAWYARFIDPSGIVRGVRMVTDALGEVAFQSYLVSEDSDGERLGQFVDGTPTPAEPESNYSDDGTITLVIDAQNIGIPDGGLLSDFLVGSFKGVTTPVLSFSLNGDAMPNGNAAGSGEDYDVPTRNSCAPNAAPLAALAASPVTGDAPLSVTLDATGSSDADGSIVSYTFTPGDGSPTVTNTTGTLTHSYDVGTWQAEVVVTDDLGAVSTNPAVAQITVSDGSGGGNTAGPGSTIDAMLAVSGDGSEAEDEAVNGDAETVFTFDASDSGYTDAVGSDLRYTFVFGDEASEEEFAPATSDPIATHRYGAAGTYTAYVIVSDAFGNSDTSNSVTITTTITITVEGDNGTVAQLTVDETSGPAPLRVAFDGSRSFTSDGKTITEYCFDFDDGEAPQCGTEATAVYVYTRPGSYEPSLTVTASDESTATAKATVSVGGTGSNPGTPSQPAASTGGGSGALGGLLLLPLLGFGLARRRG